MRYFKSETPDVSIYASGGQVVKWATVDGAVGWYATEREANIKAILKCIEKKVGGQIALPGGGTRSSISEIQEPEYLELAKKAKGAPLFRPDREHISAEGMVQPQRIAPARQSGVVAVAGEPQKTIVDAGRPSIVPAAPAEPELRKRGRPRKT